MTTFYTVSGNPVAQTRGTSPLVRSEFLLIQTAFANVNTDLQTEITNRTNADALKAAKAGDTYTGTHDFTAGSALVATQTAGDNSTKAASTAFVVATSLNANLPGQGGNSGKFITTNGTTASWGFPAVSRSARTSNTILAAADQSKLIDITSGTFTQTLTAAATLGAGWWCYLRNSGTGDVTLDPNASEQIDGLTSYIMYPGEARLIQCDGSAFRSIVLTPFVRTFTTSGTFTKPPGYSRFGGVTRGAGGSGGKSGAGGQASGGGGGAWVPFDFPAISIGTTESVAVGAGGAAVSADVTAGNAGGVSTFGALVTGYGGGAGAATGSNAAQSGGGGGGILGSGGNGSGSNATGGAPGPDTNSTSTNIGFGGGASTSSSGGAAVYGGGGGGAAQTSSNPGGPGGNSYAGGGGGGATGISAGGGGTSILSGAGGAASLAGAGVGGTAPCGGGGATQTGATSGAGARGQVDVWGIA